MKIQPIDVDSHAAVPVPIPVRPEPAKPVFFKSRIKRLFDRQFPSVLRISSVEKPPPPPSAGEAPPQYGHKDGAGGGGGSEFDPSSVCLAKMVQSYIEESSDKPFRGGGGGGRHRCNCFNGNNNDSSDDEFDGFGGFGESINTGSSLDATDFLKSLIPCVSVAERNLLADTAMIVEKNKSHQHHKSKDDLRQIVTVGLSSLGYDSSICKSKWEKSPSYPSGEYEYIDVIVSGERILIDVDFRSEFEIARSTGAYKAILQTVPYIFVGKSDRLGQIVSIVSEAAKQSLKKKGMHFPPWRRAEYMRAKWLSPFTRHKNDAVSNENDRIETEEENGKENEKEQEEPEDRSSVDSTGELELIFGEAEAEAETPTPAMNSGTVTWQPPAVRPKSVERGGGAARPVTGLASLLTEKP